MNRAARFGAAYALLRTAADFADHWAQTHNQACKKALPGREGHTALTGHVASYLACQGAALAVGNRVLGLGLRPSRIAAALAISGATHYVLDRRWPVQRLAEAIGKADFYDLGGPLGGGYRLDQAAHHLCEAIAAAVAAR